MVPRSTFHIIPLSLAAFAASTVANAGVIKTGFIDHLSDPFMPLGQGILRQQHDENTSAMVIYTGLQMMSNAFRDVWSPKLVTEAVALDDMKATCLNTEVKMRNKDDTLRQPLYISAWNDTNGKGVKYDSKNASYGRTTEGKFNAEAKVQPTSCQMRRQTI